MYIFSSKWLLCLLKRVFYIASNKSNVEAQKVMLTLLPLLEKNSANA